MEELFEKIAEEAYYDEMEKISKKKRYKRLKPRMLLKK
jgi:hypothetical protein